MTATTTNPADAVARLAQAKRALVTCHRNPDGDALGSELALVELAHTLGVDTVVVNHDPSPPNLRALPGSEHVEVSERLPEEFPDTFDLVVTVECPGLDRTGFEGLTALPILNIDHHPANPAYGEVNFLDPDAPAVGEMVWKMFGEAGVRPSADAAANLYVALTTDTGDFRYSNTTGRALRAGADMIDAGADPARVAEWVHGGKSAEAIRLLGEALRTLRFTCGGRCAVIAADQEAFTRAHAGPEHSDEIVNVPRSIAGVEAVAFFKVWQNGEVRVSLRSKGDIDVRKVAAAFGGGGHKNAAGCTLTGQLDGARQRIETALCEAVEEAT